MRTTLQGVIDPSHPFGDPPPDPALAGQTFGSFLPGSCSVTHLVDATRGPMHCGVAVADVVRIFLTTAVLVAVFAPLSLRTYRRER